MHKDLLRKATVLALGLAVLGVAACRGSAPSTGPVGFELASLDGGRVGSEDFAGQVVVLDFWATWCVPCRAQKAVLADVIPQYAADAVEVLAVNVGETDALVRDFLAGEPSPFAVVLDSDMELFTSFGLAALPSLLVLDGEGQVVDQVVGLIRPQQLHDLLAQAGLEPA